MISIITSLYKSDKYLPSYKEALLAFSEYLLKKNIPFEVIIIANEPTESEKKLQEELGQAEWLKFMEVAREPLYATWNRGVEAASGQAVGFWNADDVRYPEAVVEAEKLINIGAKLVYFPFKISRHINMLGWDLEIYNKLVESQVLEFNSETKKEFTRSMICGPFFIFSKELYKMVGPFDEQFKIAGDFDWCVRAAKKSDRFVRAKALGGEFRVDGSGLSAGGKTRHIAENNLVCRRHSITGKIQAEDENLAKEYKINQIKHKNNYINF